MDPYQVLLVDDSVIMRQLLSVFLMKYVPCEVSLAEDGVDAIAMIRKEKFDLIITDINMPRMHGLALVESIRKNIDPSPPIIIVSTKGGEADRDRGLQLGADAYITKPVKGYRLARTVFDVLRGDDGTEGSARP